MLDLFATASKLSDCLCAALEAQEYPTEEDKWKGLCCIFPGSDIELTNCCETGGTAWVSIQGGGISNAFPDLLSAPVNCTSGNRLAVTFEVGVAREACATTCDCECKEKKAQNIMLDFQAMLKGVTCCLNEDDCFDWVLVSFQFFGPEGFCAGSSMLVTVAEPMPCC